MVSWILPIREYSISLVQFNIYLMRKILTQFGYQLLKADQRSDYSHK